MNFAERRSDYHATAGNLTAAQAIAADIGAIQTPNTKHHATSGKKMKTDNIRDITEGKIVRELVFVFDQLKGMGLKSNSGPSEETRLRALLENKNELDSPEGR